MSTPLNSHTVWAWPETQAFLKRLGVDTTLPIKSVEVRMDFPGVPIVHVEHMVPPDRPAS